MGAGAAPATRPQAAGTQAEPSRPTQGDDHVGHGDQGEAATAHKAPALVTNKVRNAERAFRDAQRKQEKAEADLRDFDRDTAAAVAAAAAAAREHREKLVERIEAATERTRLREYRFDQATQEMASARGSSSAQAASWHAAAEASDVVTALGPELLALAESCKDNPEQYGRAQGLLAKLQGVSSVLQAAVDGVGHEEFDLASDDDAMSDYSVAATPQPQPVTPLAAPCQSTGTEGGHAATTRRKWSRTTGGVPFGHAAWTRQAAGDAEPGADAPPAEEGDGPPRAKGARLHCADDMEVGGETSAAVVAEAARRLEQAAQDPSVAERLRMCRQEVERQQVATDEQLQRLRQQQAETEQQAARAQAEAAAAAAAAEQCRMALEQQHHDNMVAEAYQAAEVGGVYS